MTIVKQIYWQSLGIFVICILLNDITWAKEDLREPYTVVASNVNEPGDKTLFNPRVDYDNQWMPVGYTDPLKNEPTLDYSPPTLERVRYWSEFNDGNNNKNEKPSVNTNTNNNHLNEKSEILMLGMPIKHAIYSHNKHSANQLTQTETKSSNRRSSTYYPPEPSRVLTPPPMQQNLVLFDQMPYASDHHISSNYWNNDIPPSYSDTYTEESASYLTVLKPKTSQSPYSTTLYNKDARNSIYNLAANVNSLELPEKKGPWIQSLLQKEVTNQPHLTTPQMVVAYTPHAFGITPAKFNRFSDTSNSIRSTTDMTFMFAPSTTPVPKTTLLTTTTTATTTSTTRSPLSFYKPAILPTRPPMHLIIQGHSKVTKYGAESSNSSKHYHEPKVVPITMNRDPVVKHIVLHETNGNEMQVKHLHKMQTPVIKVKSTTSSTLKKASNSPMESLLSLLDKSFADFSLGGNTEFTAENEMKKHNFTEKNSLESKKSTVESMISTITGPTTIRPINETETRGTTRLS